METVMKLLITPSEVVELAFGGPDEVRDGMVNEAVIRSAQRKFIRPVLGTLCDALAEGNYADLLDDYIKPPLALYVKMLVLPALSAQTGGLGVVRYDGDGVEAVSDESVVRLRRRLRSDADALLRIAVERIEASPEKYPEYDVAGNVLHRVSLLGGVVI